MKFLPVVCLLAATLAFTGCTAVTNAARELMGMPPLSDPSVALKPAETRWLLVKNPRFGDIASEPEYIWVEEDKVPTTITTLIRGEKAIIASPEVVARYGAPPGTGKISPRQRIALPTEATASPPAARAAATRTVAPGPTTARAPVSVEPTPPPPKAGAAAAKGGTTQAAGVAAMPANRGFVVFVDTSRVVIDLNGKDGIRPGAQVSVRRDKIAIVHPVTGELLGELDEEVATGRVTEVRDKFSVVELSTVSSGNQVKVKDRVVIR